MAGGPFPAGLPLRGSTILVNVPRLCTPSSLPQGSCSHVLYRQEHSSPSRGRDEIDGPGAGLLTVPGSPREGAHASTSLAVARARALPPSSA